MVSHPGVVSSPEIISHSESQSLINTAGNVFSDWSLSSCREGLCRGFGQGRDARIHIVTAGVGFLGSNGCFLKHEAKVVFIPGLPLTVGCAAGYS
jgi:hypothetical protein